MSEIPAEPSIAQKYHAQILGFLNTRLTESYRFYTPVIAALTGFGYVWIKSKDGLLPKDSLLLLGAFITAILLLEGALAHILAISYTYRNFQLTLENIEKFLKLDQFSPGWHPSETLKYDWEANKLWMIPELLKPAVLVLFCLLVSVSLSYGLDNCSGRWGAPLCSFILPVTPVTVISILSFSGMLLLDRHYYSKLKQTREAR